MLRRFILASAVLLVACGKPESPAPAVAKPVAAWEKRSAELSAAIKSGMTEEEVTRVAGEPKRVKTVLSSGITLVAWEYDLGENNLFKVRFDKNSRVASAQFESAVPIQ